MSEGYKAQTSAHVQTYLQMRKHESVTDVDRYTETDTNLNMDTNTDRMTHTDTNTTKHKTQAKGQMRRTDAQTRSMPAHFQFFEPSEAPCSSGPPQHPGGGFSIPASK